jgi:hypothetical protein
MTKRATRVAIAAAALLALVFTVSAAGATGEPDKQPMLGVETGVAGLGPSEPITGSFSALRRGDDRVTTQIRTASTPGLAISLWYVIFNAPEQCDAACGLDDILLMDGDGNLVLDADDQPILNQAQIDAARISIVYGGDGALVNPGGRLKLDGGLREGEIPTELGQVVVGHPDDGPVFGPGVVTGLEDAQNAEIHPVLQHHGQAHDDPDLQEQQLTTFFGACNPECGDDQFAVHG